MKKKLFWIGIIALGLTSLSLTDSHAVARHRPSCTQAYEYLVDHLRQCPPGETCIPFSANLTNLLVDVEEDGDQVYGCRLNATSTTNLMISRYPVSGVFQAIIGGIFLDELADVELREKYAHFTYNIQEVEGESADIFSMRRPQLVFSPDGGRSSQTRTIIFSSFMVNGNARVPEENIERDCSTDGYAGCTGVGDPCLGIECEEGSACVDGECVATPLIDINCAEGSMPATNSAGVSICVPVDDGGTPSAGPPPPGTNVNEMEFANQGNPNQGGGPCQLNRRGSWQNFGLSGLAFVAAFVLGYLRRKQKGV